MRKYTKILMLFLSLVLFVSLVACGEKASLSFTEEDVTIKVAQELDLTDQYLKVEGKELTLEWSTSDDSIATVNNGVIKGIKDGEVTITVKVKDKDIEASIKVKVEEVDPTSVVINNTPATVKVGEIVQLSANVLPATAKQEVEWTSSNIELATVDATGKVTFKAMGKVTITAKTKKDATVKRDVTINIVEPDPTEIVVTTATGEATVKLYEKIQMVATVNPELAISTVTWSVSNESIATINEDGLLEGKSLGKVTVTAKSTVKDEVLGTKEIEVVVPAVSSITVSAPHTIIQVEEEMNLTVSILPEIADNRMEYSSSDEDVATVDENGKIVGVGAGEVVITVKPVSNNEAEKTYNVKVIAKIAEATHKNIIVDESLKETERYAKLTIGENEYHYGINAFSDFENFKLQDESVIFVKKGTYTGSVLINKNDVTIYSENKDKNPNLFEYDFNNQAILKGRINIADKVEGLTINGLSFTGEGKVMALGELKDFTFKSNNIYDTVEVTRDWQPTRDYDVVGFITLWKSGKIVENVLIENNSFFNVSETNIAIGNTKQLTIKGNVFHNFDRDAIRVEGGYNYGTTLIEGNAFVNDVQGGYNGIYFRAVGDNGTEGTLNVIRVEDNYFKNIGNNVDLSGAISANTYQEYGAEFHIIGNTFESCLNYLWIRNNATKANHEKYKWVGNVNYNIFLGVPESYYFKSKNATDTDETNPPLTNMDYNFFGDLDGNPVDLEDSTIKAKFQSVGSLKYSFITADAIDALFVNNAWTDKAHEEEIIYEGMRLVFGETAFASISDALEAAKANGLIYVLPGTYGEEIVVSKEVRLKTMNAKLNPVEDDAAFQVDAEAATVITNTWYLNNVSNVVIEGFTFTGAARVRQYGPKNEDGIEYFRFENNYVVDTDVATIEWQQNAYEDLGVDVKENTTVPGFLSLAQYDTLIIDTDIFNNKFENVSDTNIFIIGAQNLQIYKNEFIGSDRDAIRLDFENLSGGFTINENTFENIKYNGIYIRSYANATFNIFKNTFKNIGEASSTVTPTYTKIGAISSPYYSEEGNVVFNITNNIFENNHNYISLRNNVTDVEEWNKGTTTWKANIQYNAFIDADTVEYYFNNLFASDTADTNLNTVVIDNNFYGSDLETKVEINENQFGHYDKENSNKTVFESYEELTLAFELSIPMVVDPALAGVAEDTVVYYFGEELVVGTTAFANLKDAIDNAVTGRTIQVFPGRYEATEIVVKVDDLKIYGPNAFIDPVLKMDERVDEAVVRTKLIIGEGVKNTEINGFTFEYHVTESFVMGHENGQIEGFNFSYNIFNGAAGGGGEAVLRFKQQSKEKGVKDFTLNYNYVRNVTDDRGFRLANIENLTIIGNKFEKTTTDSIRINETFGGVTGKLVVKDNIFTSVGQYGLFLGPTTLKEVIISGNIFEETGNVYGGGAISMRGFTAHEDGTTILIEKNIFKKTKSTDLRIDHTAEEATDLEIIISENEFHTDKSTIYTNFSAGVVKTEFKLNNKVYDADGKLVDFAPLFEGETPRINNAKLEVQ